MSADLFIQQTINGLSLGVVYALIGLGVTLVWGVLHVLNFAHGVIIAIGAYAALLMLQSGLPMPVAVLSGVAAGALISIVLNSTVIRWMRLREAPTFSYVVATLGVSLILTAALRAVTGGRVLSFPRAGFPTGQFVVAGVGIPKLQVAILVTSALAMLGLTLWMERTRMGRATKTVAYSHQIAELMGVNVQRVFMWCFAISGALAGLAGIAVAVDTARFSYGLGSPLLLVALAVVVLGGMGSPRGAMVGGLLLGVITVYVTVYLSSIFRPAVALLAIVVVLLFRPQGLFGREEATRV